MDDKLIEKLKKKTIYGGDLKSLKQRMQNAHKRNKRQKKIDSYNQLTNGRDWSKYKTKDTIDLRGDKTRE